MLDIYVDADGCPVKQEIYRVAGRYGLTTILVANAWMRVPQTESVKLVLVKDQFDAADDWIVEHVTANDIVVSADIVLASRCLQKAARVVDPRGRVFTENSIGEAVAVRNIMSHLRDLGTVTGGPAPLQQRDRSRFLQRLDDLIQAIRQGK